MTPSSSQNGQSTPPPQTETRLREFTCMSVHCIPGLPDSHFIILDHQEAFTALRYAQSLGTAFMVVNEDGRISVEATSEPTPLKKLKDVLHDHLEAVAVMSPVPSFSGPYLAYAGANSLGRYGRNMVAEQLFGVQLCGPLAVEVGFSVDGRGETVPTPIQAYTSRP